MRRQLLESQTTGNVVSKCSSACYTSSFQPTPQHLPIFPTTSNPLRCQSYFNLNLPAPTITDTVVTLGTTLHLQISPDGIPTGEILPYPSIPSKPHTPFTLTATSPDPDDCFIMNPHPSTIPLDTRPLPLATIATLYHPNTGLHLEIESTEPAFQLYCGRFIDVPEAKTSDGETVTARGKRCGICVEPSRYVDAAGREEWRSMCRLRKGEVWGSRSVYRAWKD